MPSKNGTTAADEAVARTEIGAIQESFCLSLKQATALHEMLPRTGVAVVEAACHSVNETSVRLTSVRRVRGAQPERCAMGHAIAYAYDLACTSNFSGAGEVIKTLGSTCAAHVLNLPPAVARAIEALGRYSRSLEKKELPQMLGEVVERLRQALVPDSEIGRRIIDEYRATPQYEEVLRAVERIKGREAEAAQPAASERRRHFNFARLCHALRTIEVCDEGDLPFTPTIVSRILRALRRLDDLDRRRGAARGAPLPCPASSPAGGSAVVTYVPSPGASAAPPASVSGGAAAPSAGVASGPAPNQTSFTFN